MSLPNSDNATQESISLRDARSFQQFYERCNLMVFRFIFGLHGGPTEDVEDLAAETFVRAWKSRRRFSGTEQAARGWLLKIARNLVIDAHRRQKSRGFSQDIELHIIPSDEPNPEAQVQVQEQIKVLWTLLQTLPDQQREILVLRYILGWRVQDIGDHLAMKENTVSVYIRRAIKRLRENWPAEGNNHEE
ncbi:MAG: RNA polymerase sigma factor [Anaerolineales bacterium]|jgi:RNA polymerase sigma-70 factor, ECF subfamily